VKKLLFLVMVIVVLGSLFFTGCNGTKTTTTTSSAPTTSAPPAAVIELKLSSWVPPQSMVGVMIDTWIERVHKLVGDKVHITHYPSGTLGANEDHYNLVVDGMADIALAGGGPTKWATRASGLPFLFDSAEQGGWVTWQLIEEKAMKLDWKDVKPLFVIPVALDNLAYSGHPIRTMADMKGMKLATGSDIGLESLKALGATDTYIPAPDMYTALERGLIDGLATNWEKAFVFKEFEVTKYRTDKIGFWLNAMIIYMNYDSWNKLPKDVQDAINSVSGLAISREYGKMMDDNDQKFRGIISGADAGAGKDAFYEITPDERAKWKTATRSVWDSYVEDADKEGIPGQEIVDYLLAKIAAFK
jgi:TRAP-type transport system periplasmic protein